MKTALEGKRKKRLLCVLNDKIWIYLHGFSDIFTVNDALNLSNSVSMRQRYDIDKVKLGDQKAFKDFFCHFYPKMMAVASRFVDEEEAKDLVQDIFCSFWEQRASLQAHDIASFLYKWLQNRCLNHLKHQEVVNAHKSEIRIAEERIRFMDEHSDCNPIFSQMQEQELRRRIEDAIDKLPPKCARAFRLFYFHEVSQKEIAQIMGISVRTVEGHIQQAMKLLKNELKDMSILIIWLLLTN